MEHRLLKQNFKVKIWKRPNRTTTSFSFWDELIKFNMRCFFISDHGSKLMITYETFHYCFPLLTLPKGGSNKNLKTNTEMER